MWQVEYTDQFEQWWDKLSMEEQAAIDVTVEDCRSEDRVSAVPWSRR